MIVKEKFKPDLSSVDALVLSHETIKDRTTQNRPNFAPFLLSLERAKLFVLIKNRPEQ